MVTDCAVLTKGEDLHSLLKAGLGAPMILECVLQAGCHEVLVLKL